MIVTTCHQSPLLASGSRPYLEKVSTTTAQYDRKSLLAAVTIPDLSHTGLVPKRALLRPDGKPSAELKATIATHLQQLPVVPSKDLKLRIRKDQRLGALMPHSPSQRWLDAYQDPFDESDDEETLTDMVFSTKKKTRRRKKIPYSVASLADAMLQAEFGSLK